MTVSATASTTSADPATAASAAATGADGTDPEQRFLKLLVTQLNNQDPLNPLDNAQLTSQLAQMSTVSGIQQLNTALQSLLSQTSANQVLQAASLVGRTVLAPGASLALQPGTPANFAVATSGSADTVSVDLTDAGGKVVRHMDLGAVSGMQQLSWDGLDNDGNAVAAGSYSVSVTASQGGSPVGAEALTLQKVQGVGQGPNGVTLDVGGGSIALSGVLSIQ